MSAEEEKNQPLTTRTDLRFTDLKYSEPGLWLDISRPSVGHKQSQNTNLTQSYSENMIKRDTIKPVHNFVQEPTKIRSLCCLVAQSCPTLCDPMDFSQASLSFTTSQSLLKPMSIESVMPSNRLIQYRPLLLLPSIFPGIMVFSNESALRIRWPKYWSFSFNISPSNEYSGLISFRMDWFDLLAVQGTLKGLLQHHSSKAPILWRSAFFMVQLSRPYMTTGKTIPLTMEVLRKVIYLSTNIYLLSS